MLRHMHSCMDAENCAGLLCDDQKLNYNLEWLSVHDCNTIHVDIIPYRMGLEAPCVCGGGDTFCICIYNYRGINAHVLYRSLLLQ